MEWLFNYSLLTSPLHSVARFDLSWGDPDYHQEILENLKAAVKTTKSLFGSVVAGAFQITFRAKMLDNDVFSFFKNHF